MPVVRGIALLWGDALLDEGDALGDAPVALGNALLSGNALLGGAGGGAAGEVDAADEDGGVG